MQTIRTFETQYNKYYIGYGKSAKTSYEQQEEHKAERIETIKKCLFIFVLISVCIFLSFLSGELIIPMVLVCLLGIAATVTNNIAIFNQYKEED